jgi:hypothetical protein
MLADPPSKHNCVQRAELARDPISKQIDRVGHRRIVTFEQHAHVARYAGHAEQTRAVAEVVAVNCSAGRSCYPLPRRGPQCNHQAVVSELNGS